MLLLGLFGAGGPIDGVADGLLQRGIVARLVGIPGGHLGDGLYGSMHRVVGNLEEERLVFPLPDQGFGLVCFAVRQIFPWLSAGQVVDAGADRLVLVLGIVVGIGVGRWLAVVAAAAV